MKLTVVGCGDAFGSGGRHNSCYFLSDTGTGQNILVDCGMSSLTAMKAAGVDPLDIDLILITHLHGDHFGGLPFIFLERQYSPAAKTARPLVIAGPEELKERLIKLANLLYPGSFSDSFWDEYPFHILTPKTQTTFGELKILPIRANHTPESHPLSYRLETPAGTVAFSGDTGWSEDLVLIANKADLFITECSQWSGSYDMHLDYITLSGKIATLFPKRTLITHMNPDMLDRIDLIDQSLFTVANDGMILEIHSD